MYWIYSVGRQIVKRNILLKEHILMELLCLPYADYALFHGVVFSCLFLSFATNCRLVLWVSIGNRVRPIRAQLWVKCSSVWGLTNESAGEKRSMRHVILTSEPTPSQGSMIGMILTHILYSRWGEK